MACVLAIPFVLDGRTPYILQTDMTRAQAISYAERMSERGYKVFLDVDGNLPQPKDED